jgi:hypothetical protein
MEIDVEKYNRAWDLISKTSSNLVIDTYRQGKTRFRDFLYEKMGCSLLEAEEIIDEMERAGKVVFTRLQKGSRLGTWEILKE